MKTPIIIRAIGHRHGAECHLACGRTFRVPHEFHDHGFTPEIRVMKLPTARPLTSAVLPATFQLKRP